MGFLAKRETDYHNIDRKFQVHSSTILVLGTKAIIAKWQPTPPLPQTLIAYLPLPQGRVVKMLHSNDRKG